MQYHQTPTPVYSSVYDAIWVYSEDGDRTKRIDMIVMSDPVADPVARRQIVSDADLDIEPEDNFNDVSSFVDGLESVLAENDTVQERITEAKTLIRDAIEEVSDMKSDSSVGWTGDDITPSKVSGSTGGRSLFSDVDS